ncbi:MAG: HU family DNA-binding protein [Anaerolineales bacterium]|nr:HU family DNA-binding protein [Anaerolineales bacterium]
MKRVFPKNGYTGACHNPSQKGEQPVPAKYIIVPHKNPIDPDAPPKYYPRLKSSGEIDERDLLDEIVRGSTLSQADMKAALEALLQAIPRHLGNGKIVRLGDLGSFYLTIQAEGSIGPSEVGTNKIKRNRVQFRPGKVIRRMLKGISYEREQQET